MTILDLGPAARSLCDSAVAETRRFFDQGATRVQDAWLKSRAVRKLACHAKIADFLSLAYGRRAFPFQTLNFERGSEQDIHCDTIHFNSEPEGFMCGVWIALEDVVPGSGPLEYVVGSHKLPVLTMQGAGVNHADPSAADYDRTYVPALAARLEASGLASSTATLMKGQALVWAANLAHGGSPIADPSATRRSLVTHFYFEDCLYYTPMFSDAAAGRYSVRLPADVRTGGWVWPRRHGRRVRVSWPVLRSAVRRRLFSTPTIYNSRP